MHCRWLLFVIGLTLAGCSGPASVTDGQDETAQGRKLYVVKCSKCHKLYDPRKYSDEDWENWMTKMTRKARLKPEQAEMLSRYIAETYRGPKGTNAAPEGL